ncbi:DUF4339 domain-containing protein [Flavobacterium caeni]|uniref:DUF4339 domain-containing protein n=1 Tax=Flavobacterium caeni TaxID=490189 RepID=UPI000B875673
MDNEKSNPLRFEELVQLLKTTVINGQTLAWKNGLENWKPLSEFIEFETYIN